MSDVIYFRNRNKPGQYIAVLNRPPDGSHLLTTLQHTERGWETRVMNAAWLMHYESINQLPGAVKAEVESALTRITERAGPEWGLRPVPPLDEDRIQRMPIRDLKERLAWEGLDSATEHTPGAELRQAALDLVEERRREPVKPGR